MYTFVLEDKVPDSKSASCEECLHLKAAVTLWCMNDAARAYRGTLKPGVKGCLFWEATYTSDNVPIRGDYIYQSGYSQKEQKKIELRVLSILNDIIDDIKDNKYNIDDLYLFLCKNKIITFLNKLFNRKSKKEFVILQLIKFFKENYLCFDKHHLRYNRYKDLIEHIYVFQDNIINLL